MRRSKERFGPTMALLVVGLALAATHPQVALAKDDAVASKAHYESGVRHYDMSEFDQALVEFKEAYRAKPDPAFLYNIAQCHRKLGQVAEAISLYRSYLRRAPDAKNRDEVERRIVELQALQEAEAASARNAQAIGTQAWSIPPEAQQRAVAETAPPIPATTVDVSTPTEPASEPTGGVLSRWWFWTGAGAVAAVAATVLIIMAERDPTKIPSSSLGAQRVLP